MENNQNTEPTQYGVRNLPALNPTPTLFEPELFENKDIILDLFLEPQSVDIEETTVTAERRQMKITESPAAVEIISAGDIKREESTNLGSYLDGIKGVDFSSSGINNYSISVRGFNSSFSTRLLTLTDGRVANIPALRVINYSLIPQSSKDIEAIEIDVDETGPRLTDDQLYERYQKIAQNI